VRGAILTLLAERPMNGYELITELEARSEGRWRPSPGAMYPALNKMEHHGAITSVEVDHKRQFQLTDHGREMLAEYEAERAAGGDVPGRPWDDPRGGGRHDLRGQVFELVGRARQLRRVGTPEQIQQAGAIIDEATNQLDALLATSTPRTEPSESESTSE
jgi:DNA-binding PadR family transcriptional regulator